MKTKLVLLLVISSLIIGCVENPNLTTSKNIIPETYEDITNKFIKECGNTLTTAQCDDWVENHINGNYVRWNGEVVDIKDNTVYVTVKKALISGSVGLHDISYDKLINLKPKDNIVFSGKIKIEKGMFNSYKATWLQWTGMYSGLNLYDVTIENTATMTVPTENPY